MSDFHSQENVEDLSWMELVRQAVNKEELFGSTCRLYSTKQADDKSLISKRCLCGRLAQEHSFDGEIQTDPPSSSDEWGKFEHAKKAPVTVFGILQNKIKFVRWDYTRFKSSANKTTTNNKESETSLPTMAKILLTDAINKKPTLLISCYGGAKYFKMNDKLEKEFKDGIGQAAATEGVWLLSTGLNSGVSKVIGQSVWRHALLSEKPTNHTVIGLSSWGCLSKKTQIVLRRQAKLDALANNKRRISIDKMSIPLMAIGTGDYYSDSSLFMLDDNQPDTLESNHTHFLLLDDGSQGAHKIEGKTHRYYIPDEPRSIFVEELITLTQCCAVTIIIEGGLDSISVIANDLHVKPKRPVVIIHGSGRLANAIGNLLELTRDQITVRDDEIERQLKKVDAQKHLNKYCEEIQFILKPENRPYLSVFKLDDNTSLTDTIFLAVFKARIHRENEKKTDNKSDERASNLKELLDLSVNWNYVNGINYLFENKEAIDYDQKWNIDLFEKALISNRPAFVDYFLRRQYDVLQTSDYIKLNNKNNEKTIQTSATSLRAAIVSTSLFGKNQVAPVPYNEDEISSVDDDDDANIRAAFDRKFVIEKLYGNPIDHLKKFGQIRSVTDLDNLYYRLIGPYAESFFRVRSTKDRIEIDLDDKGHSLLSWLKCYKNNTTVSSVNSLKKPHLSKTYPEKTNVTPAIVPITKMNPSQEIVERYGAVTKFGNEEMLRDIFLWSVISGHAEMSFVLLLQVRSRIVASLVAAGITRRFFSTKGGYLDQWHKFQKQSKDYEQFATSCIDACYKRSERRACQLLLREIPLFGNITCMQVAITFRLKSFINSRCFDQVLNRQWYGTLDQTTNRSLLSKIFFVISVLSIGLLAPVFLDYRHDDIDKDKQEKFNISDDDRQSSSNHRWEGIQDQDGTNMNYIEKVRQFHRTPVVRMFYNFLFYIWMLLAFSYMMLFEMKSENTSIHWTEIYVIITISAMLIEDIRKIIIEYHTQMLERWHQSDLWMINLYLLPYVLFYIGIGIQFESRVRSDLFTTARIVLALDLEIWFLFSLRFVSAIKLLGPKLFMIRNMLRDLVGFIYIIFVCVAAYGIVSRSLTMYDSIEFTAKNLSAAIFYRPYWFLYGDVDDEKIDLDTIIGSINSTQDDIAQATTNQVLLAFHMLFINILILNLLIAVFNFTINDVQAKSEYFWRYQRYELIREYFEKPNFTYPPLSLLGYLWLLIKLICGRKDVLRIFKRYGTNKMNKDWTDFESAATSNYTRTFVDRMYHDSSTLIIPTFSETDELKVEIESLKHQSNDMRTIIDRMDIQSKRITPAMNWMMTAMDRVKMSSQRPPPLFTTSTSDA